MGKDLYQVLGVSKTATENEIKKAYKVLTLKWHPDKNKTNIEEATKRFQEINHAYKVLSDNETRKIYDKYGEEGLKMADGESQSFNPFDLFSSFFPNQRGMNRVEKAPPIMHSLKVPLEHLYTGYTYNFTINTMITCIPCDGTGARNKKKDKCDKCQGSGKNPIQRGGFITILPCSNCKGEGTKPLTRDQQCQECSGEGFQMKKNSHEFKIIPGMEWNMQIVLEGQGNQLRDKINGDIHLRLCPPSNANNLIRRGHNLYLKLEVNLLSALIGYEYVFTHLDGRKLYIQTTDIIKPNVLKCVKNEGMPIFTRDMLHTNKQCKHTEMEHGDLIIEFLIIFPNKLQPKQKELLQKAFVNNENGSNNTKKLDQDYIPVQLLDYIGSNDSDNQADSECEDSDKSEINCVQQ